MNQTVKIFLVVGLISLSPVLSGMASQLGENTKPICYACASFDHNELALVKSCLFKARLDPRDTRVPRFFVETCNHIPSLANWSAEHWQEFGKLEKMMELALRKTFDAELVNVACLMNLAGEEGTHTHWHFIPRLPHPITVTAPETGEAHTLQDPCYGKAYDMNGKNYVTVSSALMKAIIQRVQENLDTAILSSAELKK